MENQQNAALAAAAVRAQSTTLAMKTQDSTLLKPYVVRLSPILDRHSPGY